MGSRSDEELWAAVREAQRELNRAQADFYQHARDSVGVLRDKLTRQDGWDRASALHYLYALHTDAFALLPHLVDLLMSDRTHAYASDVISRIPPEQSIPALSPLIEQQLADGDEYAYRALGGLLRRLRAWPLLEQLAQRALSSGDPEIQAAGTDIADDPELRRASDGTPPPSP